MKRTPEKTFAPMWQQNDGLSAFILAIYKPKFVRRPFATISIRLVSRRNSMYDVTQIDFFQGIDACDSLLKCFACNALCFAYIRRLKMKSGFHTKATDEKIVVYARCADQMSTKLGLITKNVLCTGWYWKCTEVNWRIEAENERQASITAK